MGSGVKLSTLVSISGSFSSVVNSAVVFLLSPSSPSENKHKFRCYKENRQVLGGEMERTSPFLGEKYFSITVYKPLLIRKMLFQSYEKNVQGTLPTVLRKHRLKITYFVFNLISVINK